MFKIVTIKRAITNLRVINQICINNLHIRSIQALMNLTAQQVIFKFKKDYDNPMPNYNNPY